MQLWMDTTKQRSCNLSKMQNKTGSAMKINEIFNSISGEVSPFGQGCLATFVRLQGCSLACPYCDTPKAKDHSDGESLHVFDPIDDLFRHTFKLCITGGEPLEQRSAVRDLCTAYKNVWIETNGTHDFTEFVVMGASIVTDYKLDAMAGEMPLYFLNLKPTDYVKFVICNKAGFFDARDIHRRFQNGGCRATFAYSPVEKSIKPSELFTLLEQHQLPNTIMNIQIHKHLNMK